MPKDRIYLIATGDTERLVRASRGSVALAHVAQQTHKVSVATQNDLERLLAKQRVETAGEEPPEPPAGIDHHPV